MRRIFLSQSIVRRVDFACPFIYIYIYIYEYVYIHTHIMYSRVQSQGVRIKYGPPLRRCLRVTGGGPGWAAGCGVPPGSPPGLAGPALAGRGVSCGCVGAQGPSGRHQNARNPGTISRGSQSSPNSPWKKKRQGGLGAGKVLRILYALGPGPRKSTQTLRTWEVPALSLA